VDGFATITVVMIDDIWPVYLALNRAVAAGATRGTLFTGEMIDDQSAAMHMMRSQKGITWLGGKVTFLRMHPNGPAFRIDWDELPTVTE
jgi:hypothetical protein